MKRKKIVAGNWKMNCNREEALSLATEIAGMVRDEKHNETTVMIAPPFVHLASVAHLVKPDGILVAAQNCAYEPSGAFTGEVSAGMLSSAGASAVIIGHSERRQYFHENDELLLKKVQLAISNQLQPLFCIGELLPDREAGRHFDTVMSQLLNCVFKLDRESFTKLVIAYEPVWAIGTGKTATSQQAQEMHAYIRKLIAEYYDSELADGISILYGGSCNENNAKELFSMPDVDGGLIGGASLKSRSFMNIINSF
jgi:triosephosphate isomerase